MNAGDNYNRPMVGNNLLVRRCCHSKTFPRRSPNGELCGTADLEQLRLAGLYAGNSGYVAVLVHLDSENPTTADNQQERSNLYDWKSSETIRQASVKTE